MYIFCKPIHFTYSQN